MKRYIFSKVLIIHRWIEENDAYGVLLIHSDMQKKYLNDGDMTMIQFITLDPAQISYLFSTRRERSISGGTVRYRGYQ
ncbi:hypothetical protein HMPREF0083_01520 [Aneurinibacillus aneurinilyticus ATCC 12856]|jgi:hypothetical protein|uniref:Uncharacterized protein n=1 Tax=Aneurinibacillus aneurinilyticus ATCC 12856 TaxID=649747 RepID=U1YHZ4_ANEAE|nr:hypothetical protein HMPREF0083_01520 [Aneurinibacillus aneurinilyticus ATCC 12856]